MRVSVEAEIPNIEYNIVAASSAGAASAAQAIAYPNTNENQTIMITSLGCDAIIAIGPESNIAANTGTTGNRRNAATNSTRLQFTCKDGAIYKFRGSIAIHNYISVISNTTTPGVVTLNIA